MQSGSSAICLLCVLWCASHLSGWRPQLHLDAHGLRLCTRDAASPGKARCRDAAALAAAVHRRLASIPSRSR